MSPSGLGVNHVALFYYFPLQIEENMFYSTCSWYCLTVLSQVETVFHHDKAKKKKMTQGQPKVHIPKALLSSPGHAGFLVYISTFLGIRNRHLN